MTGHIVPLDAGDADLETVGGKGHSLVRRAKRPLDAMRLAVPK